MMDLTVGDVSFENPAVLVNVHVAFTAGQHQYAVGAEVPVPLDDAIVGPRRVVFGEVLVRQAREVGTQVHVGFVQRAVAGQTLEVGFAIVSHGSPPLQYPHVLLKFENGLRFQLRLRRRCGR